MKINPIKDNPYAQQLIAMQKGSTIKKPVEKKEKKPVVKLDYIGNNINLYM